MHLQSLEMIGFKSFVPRTTLRLSQGVTAIVGPNGCGKSNVLDAIRWVLGEQSAKALRGGEMADVIFSGTEVRPALGMAEVSLTFVECEKELGVEWNEICISRRVYRDGKGEYFLNKAPCRLRDIQQLFMDTGVGRSAYSIMEQGKIDLILSSRPEDRRVIFEEAAGITKYKAQKKETLRKLEYTEANLLRVQDIIKEVRRQIGSLQRQAAKARRYQGLMKDLRIFDTHVAHKNYQGLSRDLEEIRAELSRGEEERMLREGEIVRQEAEFSELRFQMGKLDEEASRLREQEQSLKSRVFSAESRIAINLERCEEARSAIERYRMDIAAAGEKMRMQQNEIEQTDQLLEHMVENLRAHEVALDEHTRKVRGVREERDAAERQIRELDAQTARFDAQLASTRSEISAAARTREAAEMRLRLLQAESQAASHAVAELKVRLQGITQRVKVAALTVEASRAEQAEMQTAFDAAQEKRQTAEIALNAISKEAAGIESRLDLLRQLQKHGDGLDEGAQALLRGLDNPELFKPAIAGAFADHIRVESRFIPAIEAALGASLQALIFKDGEVAELALQELSRRKLGKANITARDWITVSDGESCIANSRKDRSPEAAELGNRSLGGPLERPPHLPEGAIAWARTCVGGEGEAMILATRLLDGILVAETLHSAFRLKAGNPALGIATLTGEFISREGLVRGGQVAENGNRSALARRDQILQLERQLAAALRNLELKAAARTEALEALEASHDRLLVARENFQHAQVESASACNEKDHAERQLAELEDRLVNYLHEVGQLEHALGASGKHLENLESVISQLTHSLDDSRLQRAEAERAAQTLREHENIALEDLNTIRINVATERQQQESLARQRGPMALRLGELAETLSTRQSDLASHESRIQTLEEQCSTLRESIILWRADSEALEAEVAKLLSARAELSRSADSLEHALRSARQQLLHLQEQKGRQEVRVAQLEMRMENLRNHVAHRYQSNLETFAPDTYALLCSFRERNKKMVLPENAEATEAEVPPRAQKSPTPEEQSETIDWDRIEAIVTDLSERIEAMGPVNLDAIQEYDELEQRHSFLENQVTDLVNSKAELHAIIAKINRTTRDLFADTFARIRENFQVMFAELFGGGRANLMLLEEGDPLESGIEIIARPPGKQLQSISLLSGGERTMTAVSLLLAIYMVKPSPFCVLDEMDAPLDESNINRFIKILDRFVHQSQFVVITHNKRTISAADVLYGVTMEEQGVSKIVSLKLNAKQDSPQAASRGFERAEEENSTREPATV